MTVADVEKAVTHIEQISGDNEAAHSAEDSLHRAVLTAIAIGDCVDPVRCAQVAISSGSIDFERWFL